MILMEKSRSVYPRDLHAGRQDSVRGIDLYRPLSPAPGEHGIYDAQSETVTGFRFAGKEGYAFSFWNTVLNHQEQSVPGLFHLQAEGTIALGQRFVGLPAVFQQILQDQTEVLFGWQQGGITDRYP